VNDKYNFKNIVEQFQFEGRFLGAEEHGDGHINESFVAFFEKEDGEVHKYILQKINSTIFRSPEKLMENIENVTSHIRGKVIAAGGNPDRESLNLVWTKDGKSFYKSEAGEYWRGFAFIEGARTYLVVENPTHLYNAGRAFGRFQQYLADFDAEKLHVTIPDFHNTEKRFQDFLGAVKNDLMGRRESAQAEIQFVMERENDTKILGELLREGKLPNRVTHNDTKFNNVMIDNVTGDGICVLDLDTVMPGLSLYDFGDAIRSGANSAEEDEPDVSKVWLDINLFENFTKGYIETAGHTLTDLELEYMPFSAKLITLELGMRFLGDYLNGDVYFRTHREKHNLERARVQFTLVADIERKLQLMKEIIQNIAEKL
jgi:Ser/Thr protein kinase RdoA (MazF antagonist)